MSGADDDKPTIVIDLNALKKKKQAEEDELANIAQDLEFSVGPEGDAKEEVKSEDFAAQFLAARDQKSSSPEKAPAMTIVLVDLESKFFQTALPDFPKGFTYVIAKSLQELTAHLQSKKAHLVVFNYDVNPKVANSLVAQIKKKFKAVKTMIMAKKLSPQKVREHQQTPGGAHAYYQYPIEAKKLEAELTKLKKAA